jgi:hypothetical protein
MHTKVDFVRAVDESTFAQLYHVLTHVLCEGTCSYVEPGNIISDNLRDGTPRTIRNPHSDSILGVRVQIFDGTEAGEIFYSFEYLLTFNLHTNAIFELIFDILVGKVDKSVEDLGMRRH